MPERCDSMEKKDDKKLLSTICILAAGSLWGTMGLFVRNLSVDGLTSVEISTIRPIISTILMCVFLLIKNKSLDKNREQSLFEIRMKDMWVFVGTGVISLTFFNICYFTTITRTSMAIAAILMYTSPVFIVIFSFFLFKEKIFPVKIIALFVALAGIVLVTGVFSSGDSQISVITLLIGLGSGIGYALYSIFGRFAIKKEYSSETITFYTFLFAAVGMILYNMILGGIAGDIFGNFVTLYDKIANGRTMTDILLFAGQAVIATVLPYLLYTKGLENIENGKAGIMASVEPVVAALIGMLVYGEVLSATGYMGVFLVLAAIVLLQK